VSKTPTVGFEEVAHEELGDVAAGGEEGLASYGGAHGRKLGDVLDEAPDALQAARQQAPDDCRQALSLPPPPLLRPATTTTRFETVSRQQNA